MKTDLQDLNEFIAHYERISGMRLSDDEARVMLSRLLRLYRALLKPISDERKSEHTYEEHSHHQELPEAPSAL